MLNMKNELHKEKRGEAFIDMLLQQVVGGKDRWFNSSILLAKKKSIDPPCTFSKPQAHLYKLSILSQSCNKRKRLKNVHFNTGGWPPSYYLVQQRHDP